MDKRAIGARTKSNERAILTPVPSTQLQEPAVSDTGHRRDLALTSGASYSDHTASVSGIVEHYRSTRIRRSSSQDMRKSSRPSDLILRHSASSPDIRRAFIQPSEPSQALIVADLKISKEALQCSQIKDSAASTSDDYSCNICFDVANDAVLTCCGHLYCWCCLYQWLILPSQLDSPICPVCKSGCDLASLTPVYGRGGNMTAKAHTTTTSTKLRTLSTESQIKPKNMLDQWLVPHLHPPTLPMLPAGETPARPVARRQPVLHRVHKSNILTSHQTPSPSNMFGGTHPVVIFSAGVTTLCGMQILQNGGFGTTDALENGTNTSKMMWLLAFFIIAGVWFH